MSQPGQGVRTLINGGGKHNRGEMAYIALLEACISLFVPDLDSKDIGGEIKKLKKSLAKQTYKRRRPAAHKETARAQNSKTNTRRNNNVQHEIGKKFLAYFA